MRARRTSALVGKDGASRGAPVIGTMWPEFWKELTSPPEAGERDVNHQARELLVHDADMIDVPDTFTSADRAEVGRQLVTDPRLAAAEAACADGKVIRCWLGDLNSCNATNIPPMPKTGSETLY